MSPRIEEIVPQISEIMLRGLSLGDLAELRRMSGALEPAAFWRLASECAFIDHPDRWRPVVQLMALLAPKGERQDRDRLHVGRRRLGEVLADGGDPDWIGGPDARPFVSEARLARFLAASNENRAPALTRMIRALASARDRASGVNCIDIAALLLRADPTENLRHIAQNYYRRLDSARQKTSEEQAHD